MKCRVIKMQRSFQRAGITQRHHSQNFYSQQILYCSFSNPNYLSKFIQLILPPVPLDYYCVVKQDIIGPFHSLITVLCCPKHNLNCLFHKLSGVCSYWFLFVDSASCIFVYFLQIFTDIERSHSGFSQCAATLISNHSQF